MKGQTGRSPGPLNEKSLDAVRGEAGARSGSMTRRKGWSCRRGDLRTGARLSETSRIAGSDDPQGDSTAEWVWAIRLSGTARRG